MKVFCLLLLFPVIALADERDGCFSKSVSDADAYCRANAKVTCEPYVKQVCGDAKAVCKGNDVALEIAIKLGEVAQSCQNANEQSVATTQTCGNVSVVCPEPHAPPVQDCPAVTIGTRTLHCAFERVLKDGTIIRRRCLVVTEAY